MGRGTDMFKSDQAMEKNKRSKKKGKANEKMYGLSKFEIMPGTNCISFFADKESFKKGTYRLV